MNHQSIENSTYCTQAAHDTQVTFLEADSHDRGVSSGRLDRFPPVFVRRGEGEGLDGQVLLDLHSLVHLQTIII